MASVTDNEKHTDQETVTSSDNVTKNGHDIIGDNDAVTDNVTVTEYSSRTLTNVIHAENLDEVLPHPLPSSNRKINCLFLIDFLE